MTPWTLRGEVAGDESQDVTAGGGLNWRRVNDRGITRASTRRPVEGVQRVAHRALVRVQTRNDDEA